MTKRKEPKRNLLEPRTYYKPFEYPKAFEFFETHERMHWVHNKQPLHQDLLDWKHKLTQNERDFLTQVFRFFTQADLDVAGAYVDKYLTMFKKPEVRMMLCSFAAAEARHVAAYSHLIDTLGMPEVTYKQFAEYKEMRDKHEYTEQFMGTDKDKIVQQMAVFSAFTEGMQLFSSFIMLLNFTRFNKMIGMGQIITYSIRDESVHVKGMTWLFKTFISEHIGIWTDELKAQLYEIAKKMVALEDKFIDLAFATGGVQGLTSEEVKQYIRYIADRRLIELGMKSVYNVRTNPLPWVEDMVNAPELANFFETYSAAYSKWAPTDWHEVWHN